MTNENKLEYVDMTDEELADCKEAAKHLKEATKHAKLTLQMDENCYQKFGKKILSDEQKLYFENVANGVLPTDEEQISFDIEAVKQARFAEKEQSLQLGEAYEPVLFLEDKTEGFAVN